jgi:hypothetical protein
VSEIGKALFENGTRLGMSQFTAGTQLRAMIDVRIIDAAERTRIRVKAADALVTPQKKRVEELLARATCYRYLPAIQSISY